MVSKRRFLRLLASAVAAPLFIPASRLDFGVPSGRLSPDDWHLTLYRPQPYSPTRLLGIDDHPSLLYGDGIHDDTAALQQVMDAAGEGGMVNGLDGVYRTTAPIELRHSYQRIRGMHLLPDGDHPAILIPGMVEGVGLDSVTIEYPRPGAERAERIAFHPEHEGVLRPKGRLGF
jgi:hypothetical protein